MSAESEAKDLRKVRELVLAAVDEAAFTQRTWCHFAKALAVASLRPSELPRLDQLREDIRQLEQLIERQPTGPLSLREGMGNELESLREEYRKALEEAHALLADTSRRADRVACALYDAAASKEPRDLTASEALDCLESSDPEKQAVLTAHLDSLRDDLLAGKGITSTPADPVAEQLDRVADRLLASVGPMGALSGRFSSLRAELGTVGEELDSLQRSVMQTLLGDGELRAAVKEAKAAAYAAIGQVVPGTFAWAREQHAQGVSTESLSSGGTICAGTEWAAHRFSPSAFDATDWKLNDGGEGLMPQPGRP